MSESSSSSDDEEINNEGNFYFWNNWKPGNAERCRKSIKNDLSEVRKGNWLQPCRPSSDRCNVPSKIETHFSTCAVSCNEDWGYRLKWGDSFGDVDEGTSTWTHIHPGVFENLKLLINSYGNIECKATAELKSTLPEERGYVVLSQESHMMMLLGMPRHQWTALMDTVIASEESLSYMADKKSTKSCGPLQELWCSLCQRLNWLPTISIRLKRSGVFKATQFLKIHPKFIVEDMRTFDGQSIS